MQASLMVMDFDFTLLGELPHYTGLTIKREFWGVGSFKLTVKQGLPGAELLKRDQLLYFPDAPEKTMLITKLTVKGGTVTADGPMLKGVVKRRIALPPPTVADGDPYGHFGWDVVTCDAESAYLHYAANNLTAPEDEKRTIPGMVLGENMHRGATLPWQARFDKLEDLFGDIGEATGLGWDVRPDFAAKQLVFAAWEGKDRTTGTARCLLSPAVGNVGAVTVIDDAGAAVTTLYAGGAGEDENRLIMAYGVENERLLRQESFADCGSVDDADMLEMAGRRKLSEPRLTLTADALDGGLCRYERDYDVGDIVTVIGEGRRMDARLIAMEEVYESGGRKLKATFGDAPVTLTGVLRKNQQQTVR